MNALVFLQRVGAINLPKSTLELAVGVNPGPEELEGHHESEPYRPRRAIALLRYLAVCIVGVAFALGMYSLARKVYAPKPTLAVFAMSGQRIDSTTVLYGLTITAPQPIPDIVRFCIEAPKDGQFVDPPILAIPKISVKDKIKGVFVMVDKIGVTYEREGPNLDCYSVEDLQRQDKLFISYRIYQPDDSAGLRVVPVGNVRVVERRSGQ
jgi:hypothetical protein